VEFSSTGRVQQRWMIGPVGAGGSAGTPAGTTWQSCSGLAATCGPYGTESCCAVCWCQWIVLALLRRRGLSRTTAFRPRSATSRSTGTRSRWAGSALCEGGSGNESEPAGCGRRRASPYHRIGVGLGVECEIGRGHAKPQVPLSSAIQSNATWTDAPGGEREPADELPSLVTKAFGVLRLGRW